MGKKSSTEIVLQLADNSEPAPTKNLDKLVRLCLLVQYVTKPSLNKNQGWSLERPACYCNKRFQIKSLTYYLYLSVSTLFLTTFWSPKKIFPAIRGFFSNTIWKSHQRVFSETIFCIILTSLNSFSKSSHIRNKTFQGSKNRFSVKTWLVSLDCSKVIMLR